MCYFALHTHCNMNHRHALQQTNIYLAIPPSASYIAACCLSNTDDSNLGKRKRDQEEEDKVLMDIVGIVEEASCELEKYSFKVRSCSIHSGCGLIHLRN